AERLKQAHAAGAGTGQAADDANEALIDAEKQLAVQQAGLAVVQQSVVQATRTMAAVTLRSPTAGRVVQRAVQAGEHVDAHEVVLHLLPAGPRIVRADLNESLVGRVRVGMRAEVVSIADNSVVHGARVVSVGEVFGPPRLPDPAGGESLVDARAVECLLQLDNAELRVGQRVLVRFLR
ncbi:MAG: HlyD family secretion protein, partial [Burkholderiaceae bacterium]|nr:HlyD family secretion protein [Burkholderiaceae bacterium]